MKIVIGVDADDLYLEAVHLLGRLEFASCETVLAYVGGTDPSSGQTGKGEGSYAQRILGEASEACDAANLGPSRKCVHLHGSPSAEIRGAASTESADLIGIGSRRQGRIGSAFLGSVGRTLAIQGDRSFLVGRSGVTTRGNVQAIFATDHSEYADRCLEELLRMDPAGLTEIHLVFANDGDRRSLAQASGSSNEECLEPDDLLSSVRAKGERLVQQCLEAGRIADYHIVEGSALDALRGAMYAKRADLLILGARGQGFPERLRIGSLSLHMVVAEPFSVLVLRPPEEEEEH